MYLSFNNLYISFISWHFPITLIITPIIIHEGTKIVMQGLLIFFLQNEFSNISLLCQTSALIDSHDVCCLAMLCQGLVVFAYLQMQMHESYVCTWACAVSACPQFSVVKCQFVFKVIVGIHCNGVILLWYPEFALIRNSQTNAPGRVSWKVAVDLM